ncbi:DUF881 domain-containing protein [Bacillus horti]|uniref:Uncharacterized protein YlxW (UPF0749 family) n=1 Tax=Caldalkalibacillus horti TaxID=77523 RepID=A0ABT9VVF7_9BACI|nr:DUF881 domain-containing protein [Bacillus horti]MDQ0164610.1 uncharacterized protein YlxW (UPF0749 family) [Bacillus horti]
MKVRSKHVYLTLVALCAGFLISFSYQYTQDQGDTSYRSTLEWVQEDQLREKHNEVRKENSLYEQYLRELQQQISVKEAEMSEAQTDLSAIQHELEMLRLMAGLSEGAGPGITVSLEDSSFAADSHNPNDYIVHEQDVRRVVNELFASGAEGLSINGQRVTHLTNIRCVGPTIIVNGVKSSAPFQITAIGDQETLNQGLLLPGGVADSLRGWGITVKIEKHESLLLPAFIGKF